MISTDSRGFPTYPSRGRSICRPLISRALCSPSTALPFGVVVTRLRSIACLPKRFSGTLQQEKTDMKLLKLISVLALLIAAPTSSMAQPVGNCIVVDDIVGGFTEGYDSNCADLGQAGIAEETEGYIGLSWKLGANFSEPLFSVGVRSVSGSGGDSLKGADLRAIFDVKKNFGLDSVKLGYLTGKPDAILNFGGAYSFANREALATVAISRGPAEIGVDYGMKSRSMEAFVSLTSLAEPKAGSACANGFSEEPLAPIAIIGLGFNVPPGATSICIDRGTLIPLN